jgi:hypothetical protein
MQTRINREKSTFYKIIGAPKKFKNCPSPLFRHRTDHPMHVLKSQIHLVRQSNWSKEDHFLYLLPLIKEQQIYCKYIRAVKYSIDVKYFCITNNCINVVSYKIKQNAVSPILMFSFEVCFGIAPFSVILCETRQLGPYSDRSDLRFEAFFCKRD